MSILKDLLGKRNVLTIQKTRFYVDQDIYESIKTSKSDLKIIVTPIKGKHPKGIYNIPYSTDLTFIETKQGTFNWNSHKNFHQDGVPSALRQCFNYA